MMFLTAFKAIFLALCLLEANAKVLTLEDFNSLGRVDTVSNTRTSSKVILSVQRYIGTKLASTLYLKDTADTKSELLQLNIKKFNYVFMVDESSILVQKGDDNDVLQFFYGKINATDEEFQQVTNFTRDTSSVNVMAEKQTIYFKMPITDPIKRDDGALFTVYNISGPRSLDGWEKQNEVHHIYAAKYSIENGSMVISSTIDIFANVEKPFNVVAYEITDDASVIVFTAPLDTVQHVYKDQINNHMFIMPTDMSKQPIMISDVTTGVSETKMFSMSPSGNTVFWFTDDSSNANLASGFHTYNIQTGQKKAHLIGFDHFVTANRILNDNVVALTAYHNDTSKLYAYDLSTTRIAVLSGGDVFVDIKQSIMKGSKLIVKVSNANTPPELTIFDTKTWKAEPLTSVNTAFINEFERHSISHISFQGSNNETVTGFIHIPTEFDPSKRYPAVLMSHGGPNNEAWLNTWWEGSVWNPVLFASKGYFVINVNYHGSPGHGKRFMESIYGNWGESPYHDTLMGLDHALKQYPQIEEKRVCAMGPSFGGFMTNWISVQRPERFACFITHAGYFDLNFSYLTMGLPKYYNDHQLRKPGYDFNSVVDFSKYSPSAHIKNLAKPMLISHGGKDTNVPTDQGLAAYTALQYRNIPTKFIHFPDEGHVVKHPGNFAVQFNAYLDWLNTYAK